MSRSPAIYRKQAGFTFVEVLAAMVFLGILMPVVISALTLSNRAAVLAERTGIATQLAENQLNELIVNEAWDSGGAGAEFGPEFPGYRWSSSRTNWVADAALSELTVTVYFLVQGQEYNVHLTTLTSELLETP